MPETVECSECGASYDSDSHPFCPRCGSTSRGAPLPGAVASAARHAPGRRRVQASGAVLLAIGVLFALSSTAGFFLPEQAALESFAESMEGQPGGSLRVVFPAAAPANVTVTDRDGDVLEESAADGGTVEVDLERAVAVVVARQGNATWNQTVIVGTGDVLTLRLPDVPVEDAPIVASPLISGTLRAAPWVGLGLGAVLVASGLCALLLRAWGVAAAGALVALLLMIFVLFVLVLAGLLFAVPLGASAYFILRGRRHFRRQATPPLPPAPGQQPPP